MEENYGANDNTTIKPNCDAPVIVLINIEQ
jgi:hypothetical protein